jgi:hypothetical protein
MRGGCATVNFYQKPRRTLLHSNMQFDIYILALNYRECQYDDFTGF